MFKPGACETTNRTLLSNIAESLGLDATKYENNRELCLAINGIEEQYKKSGDLIWRFEPNLSLFKLEKLIGKGSFGTVYQATRNNDGKKLAVKFLHGIASDKLKLISEEIIIMQKIQKENGCVNGIICYLDHFITPAPDNKLRYVIVFEFLKGIDLFDLNEQMKKKAGVDLYTLRTLLRNTLDSLAKLHSKGIAHRDIKPENLRIIEDDEVVLLDLGLSCSIDSAPLCRDTKRFVGTICLSSSPEIIDKLWTDDAVTISSDVFAVGMSFWPMVFLEEPPICIDDRESDEEKIAALKKFQRPSLELLQQKIKDPELAQVYYDILAPLSADRPTAAAARDRIKIHKVE